MSYAGLPTEAREGTFSPSVRALADRAFSRAAGAPLVAGNAVRLLRDAGENYPAWLDAIRRASHHVHFESYILACSRRPTVTGCWGMPASRSR